MKIYEVLRKLDPTSPIDVYLVIGYSSQKPYRNFFLDSDRIQAYRRAGWLQLDPDPYDATVLRIYVRNGSITLTAKLKDN